MIIRPQAPVAATDIVQAQISQRTEAYKLYVVGLQQIVDDIKPGEQNFVGWRYITDIAPDMALGGQIQQTASTQPPEFVGFTYGPRLARVPRQAAKLETSASVPPGAPWELVLLSIPGLLLESFWLQQSGGDGSTDLVVPYDTPPQPLEEMHVYQRDAFLDIVR